MLNFVPLSKKNKAVQYLIDQIPDETMRKVKNLLFTNLVIQPFMTGFQAVSIHLEYPAIIRHQAIDLTFHIRCLCIDRSRKAPGNQWTKVVQ